MMFAASFFDLQGIFPLIGDISPDYAPEWLGGVLPLYVFHLNRGQTGHDREEPAQGWARFFSAKVAPATSVSELRRGARQLIDYRKIETENWSVIAHVNSLGYPFAPGHGHQDSLSFLAVYGGRELVIDPGRVDYCSRDMARSECHNSLIIDDRPAEYFRRSYMGERFLVQKSFKETEVESDSSKILVRHWGYGHNGIKVEREYFFERDDLVVQNRVEGRGRHKVAMLLHLKGSDIGRVEWPGLGHVVSISPALRSRRYGESETCMRIRWEGIMELPWSGQIRLRGDRS